MANCGLQDPMMPGEGSKTADITCNRFIKTPHIMDKRTFIKSALAGTVAASVSSFSLLACNDDRKNQFDYWAWTRSNPEDKDEGLASRYRGWRDAGIVGIFFEDDSERHYRIAKAQGLQTHRWMWTLNRGEKELLQNHPDWYSVSRSGKSCADNPPYVSYYRFLCPSHPQVPDYLESKAREQLEKDYVDGLHLDYIRYVDVILPVNLWDKYGLDQNCELPDYDFCYSEYSKAAFKEETGIDIDSVARPEQSLSWRNFRYRQVNNVVSRIAGVAKTHQKPLTAAVFPAPEVARRIVRQDWTNWDLDAVYPMIYHGFYKEPVHWIGEAVQEGVNQLNGKFPLYAGLFLSDFHSMEELKTGMMLSKQNGAAGVSLFGNISDEVLQVLKQFHVG